MQFIASNSWIHELRSICNLLQIIQGALAPWDVEWNNGNITNAGNLSTIEVGKERNVDGLYPVTLYFSNQIGTFEYGKTVYF